MARNTLQDNRVVSFNHEIKERYSEVDIFSTQGRIGRRSYFVYSIVLPFVCFSILASLAGAIANIGSFGNIANIVSFGLLALATVVLFMIIVRLTIQRCHDFNASEWLAVFAIIPFANIIFSLIPGNNGLNSYGEAPEPPSTFVKTGVVILALILVTLAVFSLFKVINVNYLLSYFQ